MKKRKIQTKIRDEFLFKKVVVGALLLVLLEQRIRSGANHAGRLSAAMWHSSLEQQCRIPLQRRMTGGWFAEKDCLMSGIVVMT